MTSHPTAQRSSSSSSPPPAESRTLDSLLRLALTGEPLRLTSGVIVAAAGPGYLDVTVDGVELRVPRLAHVDATAGKTVYMLTGRDFALAIGYVTAT